MEINEIKKLLMSAVALDEVYVSGDGSHFQIIAVSEQFAGMNRVKKQQIIYEPLMQYICNNSIHAMSIKVYTRDEWQRNRQLKNF